MKIMKGLISEKILTKESSFTWMQTDLSSYAPDTILVQRIKEHQDSLHFIIFAGTWCEDSHYILPRLFKLIHTAKIPVEKVSLLGVDRNKKTLGFFTESFLIGRVPTIIIMLKGREAGRVIEYGKYGNIEKDISEILQL
jgi:hypothetical protein